MLKKIFVLVIFLFLFAGPAIAHGGFEKNAGNTIVYINQLPVSPLVGEKVDFTFQLRDQNVKVDKDLSVQNLSKIPVEVAINDTFYGDESKDKEIYRKEFITDENGNFSFSYKFPKENYYDIEFHFADHKGIPQETGFLVQPRAPRQNNLLWYLMPTLITGLLIGFLISTRLEK